MRIRGEQLRLIGAALETRFESALAAHIREHHAEASAGISDPDLLARVRFGVLQAKRYNLTWQSSIACFVGLMFEYGPSFADHPLINPYLRSSQPDLALDKAIDSLADEQWERIDRETRKTWRV
jgi:hypothetical protein